MKQSEAQVLTIDHRFFSKGQATIIKYDKPCEKPTTYCVGQDEIED